MENFRLRGMGVALITPFLPDYNIDFRALENLVEHVIASGADYLVVLGTTAETPTLTPQERNQVKTFVRDLVKGRIPLVLGMGGNCTAALTDELRNADTEGYSAILSVTPFYNKPSQEGIYQHFAAVAQASPLPIILYNVPGRTGSNISAATTLRLAHDFNNIIAIKEASGDFRQIEEIINHKPSHFEVISGDDAVTYPLITLGAEGVISVIGNLYPKEFSDMVHYCLEGDYKKALPIHNGFAKVYEDLMSHGNPAGLKALLHKEGRIYNVLRLPLVAVDL